MSLSKEDQEYLLPKNENNNHLDYFTNKPAKLWGLKEYMEHHCDNNHLSRSALKAIMHQYYVDLKRLSTISHLPAPVVDHVKSLMQEKHTVNEFLTTGPSCKTRHQPIKITGSHANVVFANQCTNNYYSGTSTSDSDPKAGKRNHDDVKDDDGDLLDEDVWEICLGFIKSDKRKKRHEHSPANYGIVQCGHGISSRPDWPKDIYKKLLNDHKTASFPLPHQCTKYIDKVIDCVTLPDLKKYVNDIPNHDQGTDESNAIDFLQDLFTAVYLMYKSKHNLTDGESVFNHFLVYPFLVAVANANTSGCGFVPGETYLQSMTEQLRLMGKHRDDRYQYKADGVCRLFEKKKVEILLVETSNEFGSKDKSKISFDHHKGAFGTMAMLKSLADRYPYASVTLFRNIKVFFVHAAGNELHLWSLAFKCDGVYELWREAHVTINPSFGDKADFLPDFLQFFWTMKQLIKDTIDGIDKLSESHTEVKAKFRYSDTSPPLLTDTITPAIIRLSQHEDCKGMSALGPFYSPIHSPIDSPINSPENVNDD